MIFGKLKPIKSFKLNGMMGFCSYLIWLFSAVTRTLFEIIIVELFIGS